MALRTMRRRQIIGLPPRDTIFKAGTLTFA